MQTVLNDEDIFFDRNDSPTAQIPISENKGGSNKTNSHSHEMIELKKKYWPNLFEWRNSRYLLMSLYKNL